MFRSLAIILLFAGYASAGVLDDKLDAVARQFAKDAKATSEAGATAAVFPYSCDEKLAKKRVDLAVSELMTARMVNSGALKLVERSQLDTLMKEQGLGLSGAIDSATAAKVGKLAGAKLSVLGTVARVGNSYQISSKLVDTESSEIISVSIVEVPLETFDTEAARYLNLVPEHEAMGIYLGFTGWPVKSKKLAPVTPSSLGGAVITPSQTSTNFFAIAVGMRYQFAKRWLADLAIMPAAGLGTAIKYGISTATEDPPAGTMDGMGARLTIDRTTDLSRRWRAMYGAGYQAYGISYFSEGTGGVPVAGKEIRPPSGQANIYSALARAGLEYKVKNRFRWSVMGQLNQPRTVTCEMRILSGPTEVGTVKVMELEMPVFVADTSLTLYF